MKKSLLPLAAALVLVAATEARAAELTWTDAFTGTGPTWQRPTENLTGLAPGGPVPFSALSIFVETSGVYQIASQQGLSANDDFDGLLFLYAESFDPSNPLANLIAADDDGPQPNTSELSVLLTAGVIYRVVTTTDEPLGGLVSFRNTITGPGEIKPSACFLDEPHRSDTGTNLALRDGRFCVFGMWRDFDGNTGLALPSGHRTDESAQMWFFSPDNWELSFKLLNGCALNGHYWFFLAGTTNVEFELHVRDLAGHSSVAERVYRNALGTTAPTVLDTGAFDGCP
jgi:hypothetical protein